MSKRHLVALDDLPISAFFSLLDRSVELAASWSQRRMPQTLSGHRIALVVNDTGWRNTTAFQLGIASMGGTCVHAPIRLDGPEDVLDVAAYLDNWVDATIIRTPELTVLQRFAEGATSPILNARTRQNHPCETFGDLAYYWSCHRRFDGLKIVFIGPRSNILGSWIEAAKFLPLDVVQVFPERWQETAASVRRFRASADMAEVEDADIIITDCWPAGGDLYALSGYCVSAAVLDAARPNVEFLPCPPVKRGQEVSNDAMTHPRCTVVHAKAFLLHGQNALLEWILAVERG